MFERFTDKARHVLVLAQEEARNLNHERISSGHILIGLIREDRGVAARALTALGVTVQDARALVKESIGIGSGSSPGSPPFNPRAKKVLELSLREAIELGHDYIGTEHLLLAIEREGEGVAAHALASLVTDLTLVRIQVFQVLSDQPARESASQEEIPQRQVAVSPASLIVDAVRIMGERLQPDLDATTRDARTLRIAGELFGLLRERWTKIEGEAHEAHESSSDES